MIASRILLGLYLKFFNNEVFDYKKRNEFKQLHRVYSIKA
jgi:hypothetical protein